MNMNKQLGDIGEKIVAELLNAKFSVNYFDAEKDLIGPNNETIEVKTQYPLHHHSGELCTIRANQLKKCLNVDRLVFVTYDESSQISIYEVPKDRRFNFQTYTARLFRPTSRQTMHGWRIDDMKLLKQFTDSFLARQMQELSIAKAIKNTLNKRYNKEK